MLLKSRIRHYAPRVAVIAAVQVAFIVAKLTGILNWHWLLVFAPFLFIGFVLAIYLCFVGFIILITD